MSSRARWFLSAVPVLALVLPARAQLVPLGGELQVDAYTTGGQFDAAVASDGTGRFVVVWTSYGSVGSDASGSSVQGRRFDATGAPIGTQFQVNAYVTGNQSQPAVASDAAGNFLVVWGSTAGAGSDTDFDSVQAQLYDSAGAPVGSQFQVNTYTTANQNRPAVVTSGAGEFVVAWQSNGSNADPYTFSIQARRFDGAGAPASGEFQVNSYTTGQQYAPALARDAAGNFVVVWQSAGSAGTDKHLNSVHARRFDGAGSPLSAELQVNTYTTGEQFRPAVASDAAGNFVVVWESFPSTGGYDTSGGGVYARRYNSSATPIGGEFLVNTATVGSQGFPVVASDAAGNFVVAYKSDTGPGPDTSYGTSLGQQFASNGLRAGNEFQVNTYTPGSQVVMAASVDVNGAYIVLWNNGADGSVRAQRYGTGRPILGGRLLVKEAAGLEGKRKVIVLAKDLVTDIGPEVLGNPTVNGGTLRLVTTGGTSSDQTFILDADGWSAVGSTGFKYAGPTGIDGDPVQRILIKRTPRGKALLKAILKGSIGTQPLDVVPPNPGSRAGLILTIPGGGVYCTSFGGGDEGVEVRDDAQRWKMINAGGKSCPEP